MAYNVVIFDLDGTLLDTLDDMGQAVNHALGKRGFPLHSRDEFKRMVGHGIRNLVKSALPAGFQEDDRLVDECLSDFKSYYTTHIDVHTRPFEGMPELLREMRGLGVAMAVASNKFQEGTQMLIREFFPDIHFICILGNREGFPLKPDPQIVNEVLRRSGQPADAAALVGDSPTDMKTARNGGIRGIAVQWGYRDMTEGDGYSVAADPDELRALLLS
jgi:phosphoglycolate phosphatase